MSGTLPLGGWADKRRIMLSRSWAALCGLGACNHTNGDISRNPKSRNIDGRFSPSSGRMILVTPSCSTRRLKELGKDDVSSGTIPTTKMLPLGQTIKPGGAEKTQVPFAFGSSI